MKATKKATKKNTVFVETTKVTSTACFNADGLIEIRPIAELDHCVTLSGTVVKQRGVATTLPSGNAHFKPYNVGTGPRYEWHVVTANGGLKATNKSFVVEMKFKKSLTNEQILEQLTIQVNEIRNFFKTNDIDHGRNRS